MIVYKYPFPTDPVSAVLDGEWPLGSTIRLFDFQNGVPTLWVELDEKRPEPLVRHRFVVYGTGHRLSEDAKLLHVGSAMTPNGALVLHCYEELVS